MQVEDKARVVKVAVAKGVEGIDAVAEVMAQEEILEVKAVEYSMVHLVKADYVITEVDLSLDVIFRNKQKLIARKKEYKSIEEVIHIILDYGMESQEFQDLQAERTLIKSKYPKE